MTMSDHVGRIEIQIGTLLCPNKQTPNSSGSTNWMTTRRRMKDDHGNPDWSWFRPLSNFSPWTCICIYGRCSLKIHNCCPLVRFLLDCDLNTLTLAWVRRSCNFRQKIIYSHASLSAHCQQERQAKPIHYPKLRLTIVRYMKVRSNLGSLSSYVQLKSHNQPRHEEDGSLEREPSPPQQGDSLNNEGVSWEGGRTSSQHSAESELKAYLSKIRNVEQNSLIGSESNFTHLEKLILNFSTLDRLALILPKNMCPFFSHFFMIKLKTSCFKSTLHFTLFMLDRRGWVG